MGRKNCLRCAGVRQAPHVVLGSIDEVLGGSEDSPEVSGLIARGRDYERGTVGVRRKRALHRAPDRVPVALEAGELLARRRPVSS